MNEAIRNSIMLELGARRDVRVFRNNVGVGFQGRVVAERGGIVTLRNARRIRFGLLVGSADLVGWKSIVVTPEMIGRRAAIFLGIEIKAKRTPVTDRQKNWIDQVRAAGGIAGIARTIEDAEELMNANDDH